MQKQIRAFATRFGIALLACGALYLLFFVWHPWQHHLPKTTAQKVAALRSSLDQVLITASSIGSYSGNNATSADTLATEFSSFQANIKGLQQALQNAPTAVKQPERQQIQSIIGQAQSVANVYSASSNVLGLAIAYDPTTDLSNPAKLQSRAQGAQTGLNNIVNSTANTTGNSGGLQASTSGNPVVGTDTKTALQTAASCFGNLAKTPGDALKKQCIAGYPAARKVAIHNLLSNSFSSDYLQQLQSSATPLLKKLDSLTGQKQS